MAIPEYPITRREQYLDAIATNDTSVLPAEPITRTEQYLDAIARNGGGGSTGGGVLVVHVDWDVGDGTLDKTWQEIHDAALEQAVILPNDYEGTREVYYLQTASSGHGIYAVDFAHNSNGSVDWMHFSASSASDYPVYYE